jgi:hypothetical protein
MEASDYGKDRTMLLIAEKEPGVMPRGAITGSFTLHAPSM